jgi:hypothetical protein
VRILTLDLLSGMGLSSEDCELLIKQWEDREAEHMATVGGLRAEMEAPLRSAGLVPGESSDKLPDGDGFLAGLGM